MDRNVVHVDQDSTVEEISGLIERERTLEYVLTEDELDWLDFVGGRYSIGTVIRDLLDSDGILTLNTEGQRAIGEALAADDSDRATCLSDDTTLARIVWAIGPAEDDRTPIQLNSSGCESWEDTDEGWHATVVAYAGKSAARDDGSIDGSSWEFASDLPEAYACLSVSGRGKGSSEALETALDELAERLGGMGYNVEVI